LTEISSPSLVDQSVIGVPVLFFVQDQTDVRLFICCAVNLTICLSILLLLFVPKIIIMRKEETDLVSGGVTNSSEHGENVVYGGVNNSSEHDENVVSEGVTGSEHAKNVVSGRTNSSEHAEKA
jgi:hypothetical protein